MTDEAGPTPQTWPSTPVPWSTTDAPPPQQWQVGPVTEQAHVPVRAPEPRTVGPALPIVFTIAWVLLGAASSLASMFSFFLFDAGVEEVSAWTWMIFFGFWGTLLLCPTSILLAWITWAVTRRRMPGGWGRILRGAAYALPLIGILATAIGFGAGELLCGGSLTCT